MQQPTSLPIKSTKVNYKPGVLYLIPVFLSDAEAGKVFPPFLVHTVSRLRYYIAEHEKNARRFIKKIAPQVPQDQLQFFILNKHTLPDEISGYLQPLLEGNNMGLVSDAGMPAVADPGSVVVSLAHRYNLRVVPLTGPSSVLLALAASGLNGQHFEFHGYLPIDKSQLHRKIKSLVEETRKNGKTHIFIETPYRNDRMLEALIKHLPGHFKLCVAVDITGKNEQITTRPVSEWKSHRRYIGKMPAVFLFGL